MVCASFKTGAAWIIEAHGRKEYASGFGARAARKRSAKALHSSRLRRGVVVNTRTTCCAPGLLFSLALRLQFRRYAAPLDRRRDEIRDGVAATDPRRPAGLSFSFGPSRGERVHAGLRRGRRKPRRPPPAPPPPPPVHH